MTESESADLAALGRARKSAKRAYERATERLKSAVIRAAKEDVAEAEIARTAQVDRMTVRGWLGKPRKTSTDLQTTTEENQP